MFRLFSTPGWFNGWDIVFDIVGLIVAFLIAAYSWRIYHINKENRFAYLSLAFILLAVGFLFKTFTSSILYYTPIRDVAAEVLRPVAGKGLSLSLIYYRAAFFLQMVTTLGAWLLMFFVSQKPRSRLKKFYEVSQIALFIYLLLLVSIVSNFRYGVFYMTSIVLLSLIVLNYYKNYLNTNKNKRALAVMVSFLFILIGNIAFAFVFFSQGFYALGEILTLVGFLILLITYQKITKR
ncbi:MAG TPA: hypothetical protein VJI98_00415 [Candidatus Nanoarchaeia archaeon]|nr:hypothetical protein [Candidatus Nanoarchaeia archaeon]